MADEKIKDENVDDEEIDLIEDIENSDDKDNAIESTKKQKAKKVNKYEDEEVKVSFFARIKNVFKAIFRKLKKIAKNMKSELTKVTWYSRKQTFNSTLLVLIVVGVSAAIIAALDFGSSKIIEGLAEAYYQISRLISKRG